MNISLSDAITNIEVIKRGNFERFMSNLGQSQTLDLGIVDLNVQPEQRQHEPFAPVVSQQTQQEHELFSNVNLLDTFFAKDTAQESPQVTEVNGNCTHQRESTMD
jgi:hypothetical protein